MRAAQRRLAPLLIWAALISAGIALKGCRRPEIIPLPAPASLHTSPATVRTSYRGALIKWGISTADDFERARSRDPEIAAACPFGFLRPVVLKYTALQSVAYRAIPYEEFADGSYRAGSRILWTPLMAIPSGEHVFEDKYGNLVRARCGNCTRVFLKEFTPPPVNFDTAEIEFTTPPEIAFPGPAGVQFPAPVFPSPETIQEAREGRRSPLPGIFIPPAVASPVIIPFFGGRPTPAPPVTVTPEPDDFMLACAGALFLIVILAFGRPQ